MYKLAIFLLLICNSSYAQIWDPITTSKDTEYFVDRGSIRFDGSLITYSQLSNYPHGYKYGDKTVYSIIQSRLTDCVKNRFKTIGFIGYSSFDGKGDILVVSTSRERDWVSINMNKITGEIQREVCKLKN